MEKANNPAKSSHNINCLIDTDVLINWLTQEVDQNTNKELWKAPHQIIKLIENNKIKGFISIITLLEIRFVLRRKIREDVSRIVEILEVLIPDGIDLLRANELQSETPFGPYDVLLISTGINLKETTLISRDKAFLALSSKLLATATPEKFLDIISNL